LRVENAPLGFRAERTVTIRPGETTALEFHPAPR